MTIAVDFAADILDAFAELASPAVYRPRAAGEAAGFPAGQGGAAVETPALVGERLVRNTSGEFGTVAEIRVPAAQVPDPRPGDVIEIIGVSWEVLNLPGETAIRGGRPLWILYCGTDRVPNWRRG